MTAATIQTRDRCGAGWPDSTAVSSDMTGAIADMNECTLDGRSSIDPADIYNHERWRKCTASEIPPTSTTTSAGANAQRLPTADVYNPTAYRGVWVCSLPVAFGRHGDPYTRPRHLSAGPAWRSEPADVYNHERWCKCTTILHGDQWLVIFFRAASCPRPFWRRCRRRGAGSRSWPDPRKPA